MATLRIHIKVKGDADLIAAQRDEIIEVLLRHFDMDVTKRVDETRIHLKAPKFPRKVGVMTEYEAGWQDGYEDEKHSLDRDLTGKSADYRDGYHAGQRVAATERHDRFMAEYYAKHGGRQTHRM